MYCGCSQVLIAFNNQKELFVKICDFGLAQFMPITAGSFVEKLCGSAGFFAPESVTSTNGYW